VPYLVVYQYIETYELLCVGDNIHKLLKYKLNVLEAEASILVAIFPKIMKEIISSFVIEGKGDVQY